MADFEDLVKTSLFPVHESLGARMAPFSGWAMPIEYAGTVSEHEAVRADVGVFDVSHLGRVWITGERAEDTVAATFSNDPAGLEPGDSQYTLCCTPDGGIVDDLIVYRLATDRFLAVPNAANTRSVVAALGEAAEDHDTAVEDRSRETAMFAVQGPRSLEVARTLFPSAVDGVDYLGIVELDLGPSETGYVSRTGYTGEVGVELMLPQLDAPGVFKQLVDELDVTPVGLGARDTLRLEMGYPLHGNDITTGTDPFEARLSWAVKLDGRDFRGRDALAGLAQEEPSRRLWGLRASARGGIPRHGMSVHGTRDEEIGTVTSGNYSPTLGVGIALAYLDAPAGPGDEVSVDVRGSHVAFDVVKPPFVDASPKG